jgi:hypothetical protein
MEQTRFEERKTRFLELEEREAEDETITGWPMVAHIFAHVPPVQPVPGFVDRWRGRLVHQQERQRRRQSLTLLALCAMGTGILFVLFFGRFLQELRWLPIMLLEVGEGFLGIVASLWVLMETLVELCLVLPGILLALPLWMGVLLWSVMLVGLLMYIKLFTLQMVRRLDTRRSFFGETIYRFPAARW